MLKDILTWYEMAQTHSNSLSPLAKTFYQNISEGIRSIEAKAIVVHCATNLLVSKQ